MATLKYVGGYEANPSDLVDLVYVNNLLASDLPQATVDSLIAAAYVPYVTTAYVNSSDALLATPAFIDAQVATMLQINKLGVANNIAGLQAGGRLPLAIINVASSQRFPKPFISPSAYNATAVTTTSAGAYDSTGGGEIISGATSMSWSQSATTGSYVVAGVSIFGVGHVTSITYGGVTMTSLANVYMDNNSANGYLQVFGLAGVAGGPQTINVSLSTSLYATGGSTSYLHATSVVSVTEGYGQSSQPALNVSCSANQFVVQVFGTEGKKCNEITGGDNRYYNCGNFGSGGKDDDSGEHGNPAGLSISDATVTTNFAAVENDTDNWAGAAIVFTGPASTEGELYPISVADPGFVYKVFVTGTVDAASGADGHAPLVTVRIGSTTGAIVASGSGIAEVFPGGVMTQFNTAGSHTYHAPTWATQLQIVVLGAGGGGGGGGNGGAAGSWAETTTNTVAPGNAITCVVGAGGAGGEGSGNISLAGSAGGSSSVSGVGVTTTTGAGGGGGSNNGSAPTGLSPGTINYGGQPYVGGGTVVLPNNSNNLTVGPAGLSPGGGGGGGGFTGGGNQNAYGGQGADGSVWIFAVDTSVSTVPSGQVTVVPTAFYGQAQITGATTLYVMLANGTAGDSASTLRPGLWVTPIPA
jgi:hypothetical protein